MENTKEQLMVSTKPLYSQIEPISISQQASSSMIPEFMKVETVILFTIDTVVQRVVGRSSKVEIQASSLKSMVLMALMLKEISGETQFQMVQPPCLRYLNHIANSPKTIAYPMTMLKMAMNLMKIRIDSFLEYLKWWFYQRISPGMGTLLTSTAQPLNVSWLRTHPSLLVRGLLLSLESMNWVCQGYLKMTTHLGFLANDRLAISSLIDSIRVILRDILSALER